MKKLNNALAALIVAVIAGIITYLLIKTIDPDLYEYALDKVSELIWNGTLPVKNETHILIIYYGIAAVIYAFDALIAVLAAVVIFDLCFGTWTDTKCRFALPLILSFLLTGILLFVILYTKLGDKMNDPGLCVVLTVLYFLIALTGIRKKDLPQPQNVYINNTYQQPYQPGYQQPYQGQQPQQDWNAYQQPQQNYQQPQANYGYETQSYQQPQNYQQSAQYQAPAVSYPAEQPTAVYQPVQEVPTMSDPAIDLNIEVPELKPQVQQAKSRDELLIDAISAAVSPYMQDPATTAICPVNEMQITEANGQSVIIGTARCMKGEKKFRIVAAFEGDSWKVQSLQFAK